jgi:hypothetical protein
MYLGDELDNVEFWPWAWYFPRETQCSPCSNEETARSFETPISV